MNEGHASYQAAWNSASLRRLMFLIDPVNEGDDFWYIGEKAARQICVHRPSLAKVIVDYGCGIGRVLAAMPGKVRIGIDVSQGMIDAAQRLLGDECVFVRGDGASIPLPGESVDFVYSVLTLQHMDAQDAASVVSDTCRVLRPGGACYLQFSAFGLPWSKDATLPRRENIWAATMKDSIGGGHDALCYTPEILETLAGRAKFVDFAILRDSEPPGYLILVGRKNG